MKQSPSDEPLESASAQVPGDPQKIEEQEELLKQTSHLDEFFQKTPEAVVFRCDDGRILRINKEFTRIFGYEPHDLIGRRIDELIVRREYSQQLTTSGTRVYFTRRTHRQCRAG